MAKGLGKRWPLAALMAALPLPFALLTSGGPASMQQAQSQVALVYGAMGLLFAAYAAQVLYVGKVTQESLDGSRAKTSALRLFGRHALGVAAITIVMEVLGFIPFFLQGLLGSMGWQGASLKAADFLLSALLTTIAFELWFRYFRAAGRWHAPAKELRRARVLKNHKPMLLAFIVLGGVGGLLPEFGWGFAAANAISVAMSAAYWEALGLSFGGGPR